VLGFGPIRTVIAWRKFKYRNLAKLSLNEDSHEQICKQVREKADSVHTDVDFTAWIRAIQKATLLELGPEVDWIDDETLIQVRRMTAQDLKSQVDLPESKHEYEDTLDVIKLPLAIPTDKHSPARQFLFVRPDEYALFKCFTQHDWCILAGSTGISKSWFQWKFILFCYRLDLFDKFSPFEEKLLGGLKTDDRTSAEQEQVIRAGPFIPKIIVRTVSGCDSLFFFVGRTDDVLCVYHSRERLDRITDENTTILWEPGSMDTPVYYSGVKARIIVTVSPNEDFFREFNMRARMFFMPCPSELQIRLMGHIYRRISNGSKRWLTDAEIHKRVEKFGPFIRIVLNWSSLELDAFEWSQKREISSVCAANEHFYYALSGAQPIHRYDRGLNGISHHLAQYVVKRDRADPFLGYDRSHYDFSCEAVQNAFSNTIGKMLLETIRENLIVINISSYRKMEASIPIYLKRIFEISALTGLQWKCSQMQLESESVTNMMWESFSVKLNQVEHNITTFQNMNAGVLYYPSDRSFPLVDMYYKDEFGKLVGVKATNLENHHAELVLMYQRFYDMIGTSPENTELKLYYLILPSEKEHFCQAPFPESKLWCDGVGLQRKNDIVFYCLVPPDDFQLTTP